jgi:hypothetical protein
MYRGIADNSQRHPVYPRCLVDVAVAGAFCWEIFEVILIGSSVPIR